MKHLFGKPRTNKKPTIKTPKPKLLKGMVFDPKLSIAIRNDLTKLELSTFSFCTVDIPNIDKTLLYMFMADNELAATLITKDKKVICITRNEELIKHFQNPKVFFHYTPTALGYLRKATPNLAEFMVQYNELNNAKS